MESVKLNHLHYCPENLSITKIILLRNPESKNDTFRNCKHYQVDSFVPIQTLGIFDMSFPHIIIPICQQGAIQHGNISQTCFCLYP